MILSKFCLVCLEQELLLISSITANAQRLLATLMSRSNKTILDVIFYFLVIPVLGATFGFDARTSFVKVFFHG